ncbi:hypothetical protein [Aquincola tertiaricarbonis]|uniref:hypothetical protein n=1 Tax=Aquincola tertiaricarbonis TaxID=391953 RepID=UPI0012ED528C|nr:hypothetical protein [Aquincola tertiaricarbonis]
MNNALAASRWFAVTAIFISGCSHFAQELTVQALPSGYRVGDVRSALATPAVDEVVRLQPGRVKILSCRSTPPAKVVQLVAELQARFEGKLTGGLLEDCPEV